MSETSFRQALIKKGQGQQMHEDGWSRFMQTGQVHDYLAYKGHPDMEKAMSEVMTTDIGKAGETHEHGNTGFRNIDRDCDQGRADRGIR